MIYYPLSVLLLSGIKDILIISTSTTLPLIQKLLGNGFSLGIKLSYAAQEVPRGIAEAFIIGRDFIGADNVCLILGDNIFYGDGLEEKLLEVADRRSGATIFGHHVTEPQRYGIVSYTKDGKVIKIEEKPVNPRSNIAVTGLYFYDNQVVDMARALKPSARGELEITDINNMYAEKNELSLEILGRGYAWLDAGTYDSLIDASVFIKTIEDRQGYKVGCIEEAAYRMGYIDKSALLTLAHAVNNEYGEYLCNLADA
jgi:glucose-1-phosphate thymidylyltransferase